MSNERRPRLSPLDARKLWYTLRAPLRVLWIVGENAFGLLLFVSALIVFRPISYFAPRLYWKIDEHLVYLGLHYVSYWMHSAVGKVVIYGDSLEDVVNEPCLVIANHQSDADPLMLLVAFRRLETLYGRLSVVLEDIFYCTHFGIMMWLRGDFFIHQGKETRPLQQLLIQEHVRRYERLRDPRWCVLFPEGGFLGKRKERNTEYARKNGYPLLDNVLLPRLGALQALINVTSNGEFTNHVIANGNSFHHPKKRPFFRHVIDVTIAYPDRKPITLMGMLLAFSPISHVAIHFRLRKIDHSSISDADKLRTFMYDIWTEKDRLLQTFYNTGSFPDLQVEDSLPVDYICYLKTYCFAIPMLRLYSICISTVVSYFLLLTSWIFQNATSFLL